MQPPALYTYCMHIGRMSVWTGITLSLLLLIGIGISIIFQKYVGYNTNENKYDSISKKAESVQDHKLCAKIPELSGRIDCEEGAIWASRGSFQNTFIHCSSFSGSLSDYCVLNRLDRRSASSCDQIHDTRLARRCHYRFMPEELLQSSGVKSQVYILLSILGLLFFFVSVIGVARYVLKKTPPVFLGIFWAALIAWNVMIYSAFDAFNVVTYLWTILERVACSTYLPMCSASGWLFSSPTGWGLFVNVALLPCVYAGIYLLAHLLVKFTTSSRN